MDIDYNFWNFVAEKNIIISKKDVKKKCWFWNLLEPRHRIHHYQTFIICAFATSLSDVGSGASTTLNPDLYKRKSIICVVFAGIIFVSEWSKEALGFTMKYFCIYIYIFYLCLCTLLWVETLVFLYIYIYILIR